MDQLTVCLTSFIFLGIYPDIDLVRMKEYTKRDKNVLPHPSFAHSTEKGDYIKEVQNKLQYSDGKCAIFI